MPPHPGAPREGGPGAGRPRAVPATFLLSRADANSVHMHMSEVVPRLPPQFTHSPKSTDDSQVGFHDLLKSQRQRGTFLSCFCYDRSRNLLYYIDSILLDFSHLSIMQPASAGWVYRRKPRGTENIEMVLPFPSLRQMCLSEESWLQACDGLTTVYT